MKLDLTIAVLLLSGVALALPQKIRTNAQRPHYNQQQQQQLLLMHQQQQQFMQLAARAAPVNQPVDTFNIIDLLMLQKALEVETGNVVLSPTSIKTTLAMLFEGADGKSADEISSALRLDRLSRTKQEDKLHTFQKNLTTMRSPSMGNSAVPSPGSTLEVASRLFYGDEVPVTQAYSEKLQKYYNAVASSLNMSDTQRVAEEVNKWVSAATHKHIPTLVRPETLGDNPMMVLANAVFFQGAWQTAFDADATQTKCFYPEGSDKCLRVPMMETTGAFRSKLIRELDATMLELPYDDGRFSMLILLPEQRDGMSNMLRDLECCSNALTLANVDLEDSEYVVSIPKFSIEYNTDVKPVLNKLKITDIFSPSANLSRMMKHDHPGKMDPVVSNVLHKAKISIDERGAIAAGASGALVVPLMGGPQPRFEADHPFLFFIRDVQTGGFLFAGRVSQPDQVAGVEDGSSAPLAPYAESPAVQPQQAAAPAHAPAHSPAHAPAHSPAHAPAHAAMQVQPSHAAVQPGTMTTKRSSMPVDGKLDTPVEYPGNKP